jgi:Ca-activated chloride channel family protein
MNRIAALLMAGLLLASPASAQMDERADTILVLDASGSMWGQIDGVNKIVIAREVIAEVLQDLPGTLDLGLMAYGHNRRGDCSDIEMLIEPGPDTRAAIVEAVNTINPRGRTPMTDAVVAAAQALRYTENAATVILVSDGIETCEADPCAIAAELEAAGIGFTAHVIGFDVASEPEARAQMQCLAENTGGAFLTADNAEELAAALAQVAVAPPPQTAIATIVAAVEPDGTPPVSVLTWTLSSAAGEVLLGPVEAPGFNVELPAGDYVVEVLRNTQGTRHSAAFTVVAGEDTRVTVPLPALLTPVTFEARLDSADGPLIDGPVLWSFGDESDVAANPLATELQPGTYSVEAYWAASEASQTVQVSLLGADPRTVVLVFDTPLPTATLVAPDSAIAGSHIEVAWDGPGGDNDYISVARPDDSGYENYTYTREGAALDLLMPMEPGSYEIRYVQSDGRTVLASRPIEVTPVTASLVAPETAVAGSTIEVAWEGPDYANDFIAIARPDDSGYENYTYTREGAALDLLMPTEPGTYELRYVANQDRTVLASRVIEVVAVTASLMAPETAVAGSTIEVAWEGPDYANDFISIARPDDSGYENYTYTREGAALDLLMPTEPGTYELRYVANQDRTVLASRVIEVVAVTASLMAPETAVAGSTIEVAWEGPDYANDFISIARPDDSGYENYTYTREGRGAGPADADGAGDLRAPLRREPGPHGSGLARDRGRRRHRVADGARDRRCRIDHRGGVGRPGLRQRLHLRRPPGRQRIRELHLHAGRGGAGPADADGAGTYELRYVANQDRTVLATRVIEVTAISASLVAPETAVAGSTIEVTWEGPDYDNDFISVARPDDNGYENYTYTREGAALDLLMPTEPGPTSSATSRTRTARCWRRG